MLLLQCGEPYLRQHFGVEFGTRIGIRFGEVVIGQMGHQQKMQFTAIGDAVKAIGDTINKASRIESAVKETSANLLVSEAVYEQVKNNVRKKTEVPPP